MITTPEAASNYDRSLRFAVIVLLCVAATASPAVAVPTGADPNCVPIPYAEEIVTLVEPQKAAVFDPRGVWIEFSVAPFGQDIRHFFTLSATATPLSGVSVPQRLVVDTPYRLSGDTVGTSSSSAPGLWIAHISKPDVASRVSVNYSINLWQSPSGAPCQGAPSLRHIGDFLWVPTNGVGPFGQKPPVP